MRVRPCSVNENRFLVSSCCQSRARPEFDSWEAHGGVWSASRLRQNKYLRVREGRFEPKRLDTWISESCLPAARVDEYYWIHVLARVATEARRWVGPDHPPAR